MPYRGAAARISPPIAELGVCFADERPLSSADRDYLTALGGISALKLGQ